MMARVLVGVAILGAHVHAGTLVEAVPQWAMLASIAYLTATLATRFLAPASYKARPLHSQWLLVCGFDLLYFGLLYVSHLAGMDYAPLMLLPVLTAAILGPRPLALATAALAALVLIGGSMAGPGGTPWHHASRLFQAGITGAGLLALAWLISHLMQRTVHEQQARRTSHEQALQQELVSALVIEAMGDGVLIVGRDLVVHSANPAARELLGSDQSITPRQFALDMLPAWAPLARIAEATLAGRPAARQVVNLHGRDRPLSRVLVRSERTPDISGDTPGLCVMFLEDLRAMEAQLRAEKLVSMGRLSAAVAHELRNPLAAISQANALLQENPDTETGEQLRAIVAHNVQRMERTVDDILDVSRAQAATLASHALVLDDELAAFCEEWLQQNPVGSRLLLALGAADTRVQFHREHLRRLLVNLLDNAQRYASAGQSAIQVRSSVSSHHPPTLSVWSDGQAMEAGVQRHLFEPFFSSESRSSGLGLFICRQLCEQHAAVLSYRRSVREHGGTSRQGNDFEVRFSRAQTTRPAPPPGLFETMQG